MHPILFCVPAIMMLGACVREQAPARSAQVLVQRPAQPAATTVVVPRPPPPPQSELVPPPPAGVGPVVWQPGHWLLSGNNWVWQPGHYMPPPAGQTTWVPGQWLQQPTGGWVWMEGHWA
jgi:hypothetical protein